MSPDPAPPEVPIAAQSGEAAPEVFSVVSSRRVYEGAVLALRVDAVVMPGGGTAKREVVEHDRAVAVVAVDTAGDGIIHPGTAATGTAGSADTPINTGAANGVDSSGMVDTVVLIEQYRHPLGRRLWELPAGLMDIEDEPAQVAAARELFEETGFVAANWSVLVDVATSPGFTEETVRIFLATGLTQLDRPFAEHEEADLRVVRVPLAGAVSAVLAGQIVNVMAVAGILAANAVLHGGAVTTQRPDTATGMGADEPWMIHTGPGVPDAPPLDGSERP